MCPLKIAEEYDLHIFDFDRTVTKRHTHNTYSLTSANVYNQDKCTAEEIKQNTKDFAGKAMSEILRAGDKCGMATNNKYGKFIQRYLKEGAELSSEEIEKITIKHPAEKSERNPEAKKEYVREFVVENPNAINIYYYDDDPECCEKVQELEEDINKQGKNLFVIQVPDDDPEYCQHFQNIISSYVEKQENILIETPEWQNKEEASRSQITFFKGVEETSPLLQTKPKDQPEENQDTCCQCNIL